MYKGPNAASNVNNHFFDRTYVIRDGTDVMLARLGACAHILRCSLMMYTRELCNIKYEWTFFLWDLCNTGITEGAYVMLAPLGACAHTWRTVRRDACYTSHRALSAKELYVIRVTIWAEGLFLQVGGSMGTDTNHRHCNVTREWGIMISYAYVMDLVTHPSDSSPLYYYSAA